MANKSFSLSFNVLQPWMPAYSSQFSTGQKAALDHMLSIISHCEPGAHILNTPCGCGKTTAISGLIGFMATAKPEPISAIILTDRKLRLREYANAEGLKEKIQDPEFCKMNGFRMARDFDYVVANFSDDNNKSYTFAEAITTPIILMTLQKWLLLDERTRSDLVQYRGPDGLRRRDLMLVDEGVKLQEVYTLTNSILHEIQGSLIDRIPGLDDKNKASKIFSDFISLIEREEDRLLGNNSNITAPFVSPRATIASNSTDEKWFLTLLDQHKDEILTGNINFTKKLQAVKNLLNPSAATIFRGGVHEGNGYRVLYTLIDHREKFDSRLPIYILDGTAELDLMYKDWGTYHSCSAFTRDMKSLKIVVYSAKTNATAMENQTYRSTLYESIAKLTQSKGNPSTFVTGFLTYKDDLKKIFDQIHPGTYGDITGHNLWRTCDSLVKTGVLRIPRILSIVEAAGHNPQMWGYFKSFAPQNPDFETVSNMLNVASADTSDSPFKMEIDKTIISRWMVDTVQEIYRLRLRNYNCSDPMTVHIFIPVEKDSEQNVYTQFFYDLKAYYEKYGATVVLDEEHPELLELADRYRKSASGTGELGTVGKIYSTLEYYAETFGTGFLFTLADLAKNAGVSKSTLNRTLGRKKSLKKRLDQMLIPCSSKEHYYCIK